MLDLYVDADACPVKQEVYRVAARYDLDVFVVSGTRIAVPVGSRIHRVVAGSLFDAADDWIVDRIGEGDVAITADIPLAARCLAKGARVVGPKGEALTEETIGNALAHRALLEHLRVMGEVTGGPAPYEKKDRSRFLARLDQTIQDIRRGR